jgi:hypothetical protein
MSRAPYPVIHPPVKRSSPADAGLLQLSTWIDQRKPSVSSPPSTTRSRGSCLRIRRGRSVPRPRRRHSRRPAIGDHLQRLAKLTGQDRLAGRVGHVHDLPGSRPDRSSRRLHGQHDQRRRVIAFAEKGEVPSKPASSAMLGGRSRRLRCRCRGWPKEPSMSEPKLSTSAADHAVGEDERVEGAGVERGLDDAGAALVDVARHDEHAHHRQRPARPLRPSSRPCRLHALRPASRCRPFPRRPPRSCRRDPCRSRCWCRSRRPRRSRAP